MKDLNFHFGNPDTKNIIFSFPDHVHFGDQIAFINNIKNLPLESYKINASTENSKELCSYFFNTDIFTTEAATHHFNADPDALTESYKCKYVKINNKHLQKEKQFITYSFGSRYASIEKTPAYLKELINYLSDKYGVETVIETGPHIGITKSIEYITNSFVFIGIDNGASHLCRCTDTPAIIIEHIKDVERGFPSQYYMYKKAKSFEEVINYIDKII